MAEEITKRHNDELPTLDRATNTRTPRPHSAKILQLAAFFSALIATSLGCEKVNTLLQEQGLQSPSSSSPDTSPNNPKKPLSSDNPKDSPPPPPAPPPSPPDGTAFTGRYYDDKDFKNLKFIRTDKQINFNWKSGSPDSSIGPDNFSARWEGTFPFEATDYNFMVTADDGVRLYVDGICILDRWVDQPSTPYMVTRAMTGGSHAIKMEYYENGGGAIANLTWKKTSTNKEELHTILESVDRMMNNFPLMKRLKEGTLLLFPQGCTGFVFAENAIVTASHCFSQGDKNKLQGIAVINIGKDELAFAPKSYSLTKKKYRHRIGVRDHTLDVAVMISAKPLFPKSRILPVAEHQMDVRTPIVHCGHPAGQLWNTKGGYVVATQEGDTYDFSIEIYGGSSGGPVINEKGEVVSIITGGPEEMIYKASGPILYRKTIEDLVRKGEAFLKSHKDEKKKWHHVKQFQQQKPQRHRKQTHQ